MRPHISGERVALFALGFTLLAAAAGVLIKFGALEERLAENGRKLNAQTAQIEALDGRLDAARTQIRAQFQETREREAALELVLERLLTLEEVRAGGQYQPPPTHTLPAQRRRSTRRAPPPRTRGAAIEKARVEARQALPQAKDSTDPLAGLSF